MSQLESDQLQQKRAFRPKWGVVSLALALFAIPSFVLSWCAISFMAENAKAMELQLLVVFLFFVLLGVHVLMLFLAFLFGIIGLCQPRPPKEARTQKVLSRLGIFFAVLPVMLFVTFVVIVILIITYDVDVFAFLETLETFGI